jgi:hypothetical protein
MSDLTERLRSWGNWFTSCALGNPSDEVDMVMEAATEIEALRQRATDAEEAEWLAKDMLWSIWDDYSALGGTIKPECPDIATNWKAVSEDLRRENQELRKALEDILAPIAAAQRDLEPDQRLSGSAYTILTSAENLRDIARRALTMSDIHREQLDRPRIKPADRRERNDSV